MSFSTCELAASKTMRLWEQRLRAKADKPKTALTQRTQRAQRAREELHGIVCHTASEFNFWIYSCSVSPCLRGEFLPELHDSKMTCARAVFPVCVMVRAICLTPRPIGDLLRRAGQFQRGFAARLADHFDIHPAHAARPSGAEGFHGGFLGGKAAREPFGAVAMLFAVGDFRWRENALEECRSVAGDGGLDAIRLP